MKESNKNNNPVGDNTPAGFLIMKYIYRIITTIILFPVGYILDIFTYTLCGIITVIGLCSLIFGLFSFKKDLIIEGLDLIFTPFYQAFIYWIRYIKTGEFKKW